ncbi:shikimate 5-dehydrogenase [Natrialba hulunbeirensis JCM 10989]|uniref:Shikimate dehydrogenase (NADP(+)) n=1 Tax=Natrialba hulunbeirensis JCM 10989 TaxID=1227493 RepID=L9ZU35_9EURY|nr:shikimate dehydrogenase [Natrialba hulunbeirensis]ELY89586.1 shikimate 5-dehydrogenase [Natrialba hulunbeirensis JCM 10989]
MDVFGLLGNPVGHSRSPPMHEAAYDELAYDARYVTFEPDPSDLETAVAGADALGITGLNVTIPFKQDVLALDLVEPDDLATRIGAVNTIDFEPDSSRPNSSGHVTGHNTDAAGALRALREHDVTAAGADAVVVGAGGAGRAISFALADAGATVTIANRTESTAHELADDVPNATGYGLGEGVLESLLADADILVNATSVGMEEDATPVPAGALHVDLAVMDAVYQPLETRLLRDAAAAGATTVDGAWMLLYQGVEAFELWTGRDAPVDVMNEALRAQL